MNKEKIILTDCDGVVLDWEEGFSIWMEHHGHTKVDGYQYMYNIGDRYGITKEQGSKLVKQFNESAAIGFLPPLRDAQYFVKKLHEQHQYKFIAITSLSLDQKAKRLRAYNLENVFGKGTFKELVCLDTGADKDDALEPYRDSGLYWLEDKTANAVLGADLGLNTVLISHAHNADCDDERITKVDNWAQICDVIL